MEKEKELLREWQERLGLSDWVIKMNPAAEETEMPISNVCGSVDFTESIKSAYVYILDEKFYGTRIVPFDWEIILVHELLHLKFSLMDVDDWGDLRHRVLHQIIDDLARALVCAKRGTLKGGMKEDKPAMPVNKKQEDTIMKQYIGTKIIEAEPATRGECHTGATMLSTDRAAEPGYRVRYPDGYESWSPKDVFEAAYRPTNGMNFGLAIEALKLGKRARRSGWNGKGIFIELQTPDAHSKMTHPYIYIDTTGLQTDNPDAPKDRVPWLASQTDMLADDWEIAEAAEPSLKGD